MDKKNLKIAFWGTYDTGKPRVRLLIQGLKENGINISEYHKEVWSKVEDKSQISGWFSKVNFLFQWLIAYPRLIYKYIRAPKHDVIIVGYLGHLDVLLLWPLAKIRREPIVWDAFLSMYNTIVEDRKLVKEDSLLANLIFFFEKLSCKAADIILLDTLSHSEYFKQTYKLPSSKMCNVFVGAESVFFQQPKSQKKPKNSNIVSVLFYGQFIPLHGIETIIEAARLSIHDDIEWILIGKGQEQQKIENMLKETPLSKLKWIKWVKYNELIEFIHEADICLGVFSKSDKAGRVIPNKVFQILASGRPLITRDSPAIRELLNSDMKGVQLISAENAEELYMAIKQLKRSTGIYSKDRLKNIINTKAVGSSLLQCIQSKL